MRSGAPGWWYEPWELEDWVGTILNQPIEVHALLLGALVGILLGSVLVRQHSHVATLGTILVVLVVFGGLSHAHICQESYTACRHLRLKPWYFLTGVVTSYAGTIALVERLPGQSGPVNQRMDRE